MLSPTLARALATPVSTSVQEIFVEYGIADGNELEGLRQLEECFRTFDLSCEPPLGKGGLPDTRVVTRASASPLDAVLQEISQLETSVVEFKSSLWLDTKRLKHDSSCKLSDCKSDAVLISALKTIAAFANGAGGTLYIGVEDDGNICGLLSEFELIDNFKKNSDAWELKFRNFIESKFHQGKSVSSHVKSFHLVTQDGMPFVQIKVAPRKRLAFLNDAGVWKLFIRNGTQTDQIGFNEIEEHYELKKLGT